MRFATCNLTKNRIDNIACAVISKYSRMAKVIEDAGRNPASLTMTYADDIAQNLIDAGRFAFISDASLTNAQVIKVWKAIQRHLVWM